ncbi:S4 domain-containing protein YaaA [Lentibacillus saliphilus]|uniref:S4 domain-containing protein YaaA n=1 Tax=Lentibacillus saliphilus TaxID=2737028 RepID=UPI001C2F933E|nr:S4 domain-containing protein YaaA [Lentibacillus saliphilus]
MQETIVIDSEFITLGQLIKLANILESGGMVKGFIKEEGAIVNGEREHRRGRKLYPGDTVEVDGVGAFVVARN